MSQDLVEVVRRVASEEVGRQATPKWGIVSAVDPARRAVRVRLMPEDVVSGWLPVLQQGAGVNWSMSVIPEVGWQAFVIPEQGSGMSLVVVGFAPTVQTPAPLTAAETGTGGTPQATTVPAAPGDVILTGPGGIVLRITASGMYIRGNLGIDGDLVVNGRVRDQDGYLDGLRGHYNAHVHPEHDGPLTGPPSTTDP